MCDTGKREFRAKVWRCLCDCGKEKETTTNRLTMGITKSCGCLVHDKKHHKPCKNKIIRNSTLDKIGININRLTLIGFKKEIKRPLIAVLQCDCGNIIDKPYKEFIKNRIRSCGCISSEIKERALINKNNLLVIKNTPKQYRPKINFTGNKYNILLVLYWCGIHLDKKNKKHSLWYCRCDCGSFVVKSSNAFRNPHISCGCANTESHKLAAIRSGKTNKKRWRALLASMSIEYAEKPPKRRMKVTLRNAVLFKYGNLCVICGEKDTSKLHIHHLKPYWKYPNLRLLVVNNIPLCKKCHEKLHKDIGFIDTNIAEQVAYIDKHRGIVGVNTLY